MKTSNLIFLTIITVLLSSCLASNTATESSVSKKITSNLKQQVYQNANFLYPSGSYETFESFRTRTPNSDIVFNKSQLKHILSSNYQLKYNDGKRLKKPLAVSNGSELFVNVNLLKRHIESKFKGQLSNTNNDYLLAYYMNKDFIYFENECISDYGLVAKFVRYGIVYDNSKSDFIVLDRNSKIKILLTENFPELLTEFQYNDEKPNLNDVRVIMQKIFKI